MSPSSSNASAVEKTFGSFLEYVSWEKELFYSNTFPLSEKYPMIGVDSIIAAEVIYAILLWWGLSRMRADKKPLITDGRMALRVYNASQVVLSFYISYLATGTYFKKLLKSGKKDGRTLLSPVRLARVLQPGVRFAR